MVLMTSHQRNWLPRVRTDTSLLGVLSVEIFVITINVPLSVQQTEAKMDI